MSAKRVLVVAPHPDDETLGAGGTIAKFVAQGHEVAVLIVSGHLPPLYPQDAYDTTVREARRAFVHLGVSQSRFLEIPATTIGEQPVSILNARIRDMVEEIEPQIVLCPFPDRHIDHRLVFDSVMVATRPVGAARCIELLAAYETLSETHWNAPHMEPNFVPTWVVDITAEVGRKLDALRCYESQISPYPAPRSIEAAEALMRFRGTQAGFAYGEAFQVIRMIG
jgi:LmbE family N-acetylglucosaminyl deacetylase